MTSRDVRRVNASQALKTQNLPILLCISVSLSLFSFTVTSKGDPKKVVYDSFGAEKGGRKREREREREREGKERRK